MIDFHSHILPKLDDGSSSSDESCRLLRCLATQGIESVVATPHFYADNESVERFLARRKASFEALAPKMTEDMPKILLGAEVSYYQGISRLERLKDLRIEGSNLLLLEMPFFKWTEYNIKEISYIAGCGDITVILAHIERYIGLQSRSILNKLLDSDVLMQVNADFFNNFATRGKALRMLSNQTVHLIGSDCHNLTDRSPRIGEAIARIEKKLGRDFVNYINDYQKNLITR